MTAPMHKRPRAPSREEQINVGHTRADPGMRSMFRLKRLHIVIKPPQNILCLTSNSLSRCLAAFCSSSGSSSVSVSGSYYGEWYCRVPAPNGRLLRKTAAGLTHRLHCLCHQVALAPLSCKRTWQVNVLHWFRALWQPRHSWQHHKGLPGLLQEVNKWAECVWSEGECFQG